MRIYNYRKAMRDNVRSAIDEYMHDEKITVEELPEHREDIYDQFWVDDGITGNGSGSYTMNRDRARGLVLGNEELLLETIGEFCIDAETVGKKFIEQDWEYFDVSIRCYLLGETIDKVIDSITSKAVIR